MYSRGIEHVRPKGNDGKTRVADRYYTVPDSGTDSNRASIVVSGSLICQSTAASNAGVDAAKTGDTTGSPSRKILGLAATPSDPMGAALPRNQIAVAEAGTTTLIPARGNIFRCLEDGDGGFISDEDSNGTYVSFVIGAPTNTSDASTFTPNPEPNIKIDSSSVAGGTSSNRAAKLLGVDPAIRYKPGEARAFLFEFTDAFTELIG